MVLGVSCVLLLAVRVSYSKVMGKYNIGKESIAQSKDEEKKKKPQKLWIMWVQMKKAKNTLMMLKK